MVGACCRFVRHGDVHCTVVGACCRFVFVMGTSIALWSVRVVVGLCLSWGRPLHRGRCLLLVCVCHGDVHCTVVGACCRFVFVMGTSIALWSVRVVGLCLSWGRPLHCRSTLHDVVISHISHCSRAFFVAPPFFSYWDLPFLTVVKFTFFFFQ